MYPIVNNTKNKNIRKFLAFWSTQYNFNNSELYDDNISLVEYLPENIMKLFEWKNGRKLSRGKKAFPRRVNSKLLLVNSLKKEWDEATFQKAFGKERCIWKIFLMHIINKNKFPIFDMHVYRAYIKITNKKAEELSEYTEAGKFELYQKDYLPFYKRIRQQSKYIGHKKTDQALWAFGKFLSQYPLFFK